jgi:CRP-like cAMP-binding protein
VLGERVDRMTRFLDEAAATPASSASASASASANANANSNQYGETVISISDDLLVLRLRFADIAAVEAAYWRAQHRNVYDLLRAHSMFVRWSDARLFRSAALCTLRVYHEGDIMLAQGAAADCLMVLLSGEATCHRLVEVSGSRRIPIDSKAWEVTDRTEMRSVALARLTRFDVCGEDAVVAAAAHAVGVSSMTVKCTRAWTEVIVIPRAAFAIVLDALARSACRDRIAEFRRLVLYKLDRLYGGQPIVVNQEGRLFEMHAKPKQQAVSALAAAADGTVALHGTATATATAHGMATMARSASVSTLPRASNAQFFATMTAAASTAGAGAGAGAPASGTAVDTNSLIPDRVLGGGVATNGARPTAGAAAAGRISGGALLKRVVELGGRILTRVRLTDGRAVDAVPLPAIDAAVAAIRKAMKPSLQHASATTTKRIAELNASLKAARLAAIDALRSPSPPRRDAAADRAAAKAAKALAARDGKEEAPHARQPLPPLPPAIGTVAPLTEAEVADERRAARRRSNGARLALLCMARAAAAAEWTRPALSRYGMPVAAAQWTNVRLNRREVQVDDQVLSVACVTVASAVSRGETRRLRALADARREMATEQTKGARAAATRATAAASLASSSTSASSPSSSGAASPLVRASSADAAAAQARREQLAALSAAAGAFPLSADPIEFIADANRRVQIVTRSVVQMHGPAKVAAASTAAAAASVTKSMAKSGSVPALGAQSTGSSIVASTAPVKPVRSTGPATSLLAPLLRASASVSSLPDPVLMGSLHAAQKQKLSQLLLSTNVDNTNRIGALKTSTSTAALSSSSSAAALAAAAKRSAAKAAATAVAAFEPSVGDVTNAVDALIGASQRRTA